MFKILKETNRLYETVFLSLSVLFCLGISMFRCMYTGARTFLFLNWNLFLAFVPWALTSLAIIKPWIQKSKIRIGFLVIIWLLFFPNAPYILTDLFYLRRQFSMPIWYDLLLILSFAWTGLLFGFLSLWDIEHILNKFMKPVFTTVLSTLFLFIGSFGIYIGRYLRWNSWDILTDPLELMYDISDRVVNPFEHRTTWGMTIFMGLFLNLLYWSFRMIRNLPPGSDADGPLRKRSKGV
ncbi:membrane protein [Spirochaetia bacterium]|nr:membrane protein [Spirochaetia bacterium]